jgi:hypothetical protein
LLSSGWKEKEIANAFAAESLQMPIPLAHGKGGAREAFYHLSSFTCLYVATVSLVVMLFSLIDVAFPDPVDSSYWNEWKFSTIRSSLSSLIVFFPLYLVFSWLIRAETKNGTIKSGGGVERWLTYLTLFVIVMTVLIDASTLIFTLLEGDLTARVLIKAFVLLVVVGGVFAYLWMETYRWSVKKDVGKAAS